MARLDSESLEQLVSEDAHQAAPDPSPTTTETTGQELLDRALEALIDLDRYRLHRILADASVSMSGPEFRQQFIVPLLCTIGRRWQDGSLRIVHEHLASTIVRSFLAAPRHPADRARAPRILVTTPAGQYHELGALMVAAVAEEMGWDVYYLGASLPAEEIVAAVKQIGARAVALSLCYREDDSHLLDELGRLRALLGENVPLFIGGNAANAMYERLRESGLICLKDLAAFRDELQSAINA